MSKKEPLYPHVPQKKEVRFPRNPQGATGQHPAVIPKYPRQPRLKGELEFLPDSPEFLAYTIADIGYRDKIDNAFQNAIARAKRAQR